MIGERRLAVPREGARVMSPETGRPLAPEGEVVTVSVFWVRRERDKDLDLLPVPPPAPEVEAGDAPIEDAEVDVSGDELVPTEEAATDPTPSESAPISDTPKRRRNA